MTTRTIAQGRRVRVIEHGHLDVASSVPWSASSRSGSRSTLMLAYTFTNGNTEVLV